MPSEQETVIPDPPAPTACARPPWQRLLLGLLWLLWLVPVIQTTYLSEKYTVPCPVADDWVLVAQYVAKLHQEGKLTWKDMMESYVHSRSPIPKMVGVAEAELSGFDVKWGTRTTLVLTLGSLAAVIWLIGTTPFIGTWEKPFFAAFAAFFIFSPFQQTQWLVSALASNTMGITPVIGCIVLWSARLRFWTKFGLSLILALFASFSFIAGLVIWLFPPLLLWFTFPAVPRKSRLIATIVWMLAFATCLFVYFHGLEAGQSSMGLREILENWQGLLTFVLSVLGVPVSFSPKLPLESTAVIMILLYFALLVAAVGSGWRFFTTSEGFRQALPWLALIAYAGGNAMLLALGRLDITNAAFFTRYAAYSAFFYIGWLGLLRLALSIPLSSVAGGKVSRYTLAGATALLLAVSSWFYANSYAEGVRKSEFKYYATIQLRAAVQFVQAFRDLPLLTTAAWDSPNRIIVYAPPLARAGKLGPGLVPSPYTKDNLVFRPQDKSNQFQGAAEKINRKGNGDVEVTGWCLGRHDHVPADTVIVTVAPANDLAKEKVESITLERVRRKDIVKKFKTNHLNGRYGWKLAITKEKLPPGPAIIRAYAFDTDTLAFHQLAGDLKVP